MAYNQSECKFFEAINILNRKWTFYLVAILLKKEKLSFSEILKEFNNVYGLPLSSRVLTDSLSLLEEYSILIRTVQVDIRPIRAYYSLSDRGLSLSSILELFSQWSQKYYSGSNITCKCKKCFFVSEVPSKERFTKSICPFNTSIKYLKRKWVSYILILLSINRDLSFSELKRRISKVFKKSISPRVLSDTIKFLEEYKLIKRDVYADLKPIQIKYALTESGEAYSYLIGSIHSWADFNLQKSGTKKKIMCKFDKIIPYYLPLEVQAFLRS